MIKSVFTMHEINLQCSRGVLIPIPKSLTDPAIDGKGNFFYAYVDVPKYIKGGSIEEHRFIEQALRSQWDSQKIDSCISR